MILAAILRSVLVLVFAVAVSGENLRGSEESEAISLDGSRYGSRQEFYFSGARCRTANLTDEDIASREAAMATIPESLVNSAKKTVRVYFHVITNNKGKGTLSASSINAQMSVLNKAYKGSSIEFVLKGTTRTSNNKWYSAKMGSDEERQMKATLRKGAYKDLNIYTTAQSDNTLGWATFPGKVGPSFKNDGVVVDFRTLPGGSFAPYNLGHTVSHEVGHWMGLQHTFNGGCAASTSAGDKVADTPAEASPTVGCPASRNSCPGNTGGLAGNDPIHNYMDYSDDRCMNNFSKGQWTRIKKQWALYRA